MILRINGITLGQGGYEIQSPVSGLEKAPIRTSAGDYSGRDGGYVSTQFYSYRTITINGFYHANTCEQADELRFKLVDALRIRQSLPLYILMPSGKSYLAMTYVSDLKMDYTSPLAGIYRITLISPDPYLYDAGDGVDPDSGYVETYIYKRISGGYITPYQLPVPWVAGQENTIVTNDGNVDVYPEIVLEGKFTNPRITNITTGEFISIGVTTTMSDRIVIDMKAGAILLNGSSINALRSEDSTWWQLKVGDNRIELQTDSGSDVNWGIVRWRRAYQGI